MGWNCKGLEFVYAIEVISLKENALTLRCFMNIIAVVTTKKISLQYKQRGMKGQFNHVTTKISTKHKGKKKERKKKAKRHIEKSNKMAIISPINNILNINGLNSLIRNKWLDGLEKQTNPDTTVCFLQETNFRSKDT